MCDNNSTDVQKQGENRFQNVYEQNFKKLNKFTKF